MFAVVDSGDIASAIPPAISQAPKARPPKAKEVSEPPTGDVERPKKSLKEETDITKIRAKHAKEQAEQRHVVGMLTRYQQYLIALCSSSRQAEIEKMEEMCLPKEMVPRVVQTQSSGVQSAVSWALQS